MKKSQRFGSVLSPEEKLALVRLANREGGLSKAATVRRLIRKESLRLSLWPPNEEQDQSPREGAQS